MKNVFSFAKHVQIFVVGYIKDKLCLNVRL